MSKQSATPNIEQGLPTRGDDMGRLSQALLVAVLAGSSAAVSGEPPRADHHGAPEMPIPAAGTVESVSGEALRATASGWVPVRVGESLPDGTKVQLLRGAVLLVRFSSDEVERFAPAPGHRSLTIAIKRRP
jgi:hypothetical protein